MTDESRSRSEQACGQTSYYSFILSVALPLPLTVGRDEVEGGVPGPLGAVAPGIAAAAAAVQEGAADDPLAGVIWVSLERRAPSGAAMPARKAGFLTVII